MAGKLTEARLFIGHGAGIYRNDETGLRRRFFYPPKRGKWTMVEPATVPITVYGYPFFGRAALEREKRG
jgi:hypothetical protein